MARLQLGSRVGSRLDGAINSGIAGAGERPAKNRAPAQVGRTEVFGVVIRWNQAVRHPRRVARREVTGQRYVCEVVIAWQAYPLHLIALPSSRVMSFCTSLALAAQVVSSCVLLERTCGRRQVRYRGRLESSLHACSSRSSWQHDISCVG